MSGELSDGELCFRVATEILNWPEDETTHRDVEGRELGRANRREGPLETEDLRLDWSGIGLVVQAMRARGFGFTIHSPGSFTDEGLGPADAWMAKFDWETEIEYGDGKTINSNESGIAHHPSDPARVVFEAALNALGRRDEDG